MWLASRQMHDEQGTAGRPKESKQHGIMGSTCGVGTVSWTAHRPPGSFSNSSFYTFFVFGHWAVPLTVGLHALVSRPDWLTRCVLLLVVTVMVLCGLQFAVRVLCEGTVVVFVYAVSVTVGGSALLLLLSVQCRCTCRAYRGQSYGVAWCGEPCAV